MIREIHGQYPVVTPATKQFLQQFEAQSRKSKRQHIKVIFNLSLSDKAPLLFPSVLTLNHISTIRVSDGELVQSTVKNSLLDSAMISTYSLETFVTVTSFSSFLEILT